MRIFLALALLAACGSSKPAETAPPKAEETAHHEGKEEHGDMPHEVHAFHEVLAPLWHAPEGEERTTKTCGSTPTMAEKAAAIETAQTPAKADETGWKTDAKTLSDTVKALAEECARDGRPEFQTRFAAVHTAFHALTDRLGSH